MTNENAKKWLAAVFKAWENGEYQAAKGIYSQTVRGSLDQTQTFGFADIEHRMKYLAIHHQNRKYTLLDCVAVDNRIALRLSYQAYDQKLQKDEKAIIAGFYTLNAEGLVEQIDIISSQPFNYRESL